MNIALPSWFESVLFVIFCIFIAVAIVLFVLMLVSACFLMIRCIREDFKSLCDKDKNKKGGE